MLYFGSWVEAMLPTMVGKTWQWACEVAGHAVSIVE